MLKMSGLGFTGRRLPVDVEPAHEPPRNQVRRCPLRESQRNYVLESSGWLQGVRIRRNFQTREEAAAEKAALELKALQARPACVPP